MKYPPVYAYKIANSIIEDICDRDDFKISDPIHQLQILELLREKLLEIIIGEVDIPCWCRQCKRRARITQALNLASKGYSNDAIGKEMNIDESTVRALIKASE